MYRVDAKDTDALGPSNAATAQESAIQEEPFSDQTVWDQLKTVYDPEIPGNIRPHCKLPSVDGQKAVDLGGCGGKLSKSAHRCYRAQSSGGV